MNRELPAHPDGGVGMQFFRGVVARADPARHAGELHEDVLGNLTAEPDRDAADLDVADRVAFQRWDLKHDRSPRPGAPRTIVQNVDAEVPSGCDPAGRVQAVDVEPDRIR